MSDDHSRNGSSGKTFLDKISHFLSGEPQSRKELLEILGTAQENGLLDHEALSIIQGALQVSDMKVREIMIPRTQSVMIPVNAKPNEYLDLVIDSAHSRFPVYGETKDEIEGLLLAKDLLPLAAKGKLERTSLKNLIRPATFIPESKRLNVLLREFRETRTHMAVVIDEYGVMAGLVTIEDVLEQIVGEIEDEHDIDDEHLIKHGKDNQFIVKAITPIEEFNEHFKSTFSDNEFDTIGGIVLSCFGHLPERGEFIDVDSFNFKVLNADNRAIRLLEVTPLG
ncbi:magnesium/cobalt efflux protein [Gammaproteobacteria bacterium 42_54_T18]|nr:magnesium/cobalt efflux protein [Gammaproteobacteria bacterium 42_54_T18]